jgi:hypothetical protein
MSPVKSKTSHHSTAKKTKMRNDPPPVNVFDEPASSQPPRKPMVVEIEDVQSMPPADQQSSVLPPPTVVSVDTPMQQPAMQPQQQLPSFDQSNLQIPTGQSFPGTIPVPQSYGVPTQPMSTSSAGTSATSSRSCPSSFF